MKELFKTKNAEIQLIEDKGILVYRFIGDIADEDYFDIWKNVFSLTVEHQVFKFLADQSKIGKVGFSARAKVILKHLPAVKKEIGEDITTAILTSNNMVNKAGVSYMTKAFQKLTSSSAHKYLMMKARQYNGLQKTMQIKNTNR